MSTSWIASSEKIGTTTLTEACVGCKECAFMGSDAKDATPGGFAHKGGTVVAGDWKKALIERTGANRDISKLQRRNINDFIRHVPVGVLMKGTRLLHVTSSADWVTRQMVGGHIEDDYSFFTLENKGRAGTHANDFRRVVQLTLTQDVHCFFAANYLFQYWHPVERKFRNKSVTEIDQGVVRVGGDLTGLIQNAWPALYRPAAWASCSECEIAFHNSVIPRIMQVSSIGVLDDNKKAVDHVLYHHIDKLNAESATGERHRGISAPWWMSPYFHSREKVLAAQRRWQTRNVPIDDAFFE
ncbi:hypothetical protein [Caballeronia glathei]|uniref:hypothetical protein n=1 Tax=Caballeronia glathei TaxID=60547 RepID=UPI00101A7E85|nr:hypothetical protein [Caballeronia glathei]